MKRAVFIFVAALLVLLVYPSTHSQAAAPGKGIIHGPTIITSQDTPPIDQTGSGDGDDGDADDIGSVKGTKDRPQTADGTLVGHPRLELFFKMWWNFLIWIK